MHGKILVASFLVTQFSVCQIFGAPNCDLRTIFRTPRDFDQFELIERSSFEPTDKPQDIRLKEDTKPYANAQILLRIGCDKENEKKSEEPCIPLSQLTQQNILHKESVPQFQPTIYQQHLSPYHTQVPFGFPHCLYYDALGALCSHLLPLVKEVLGQSVKAKSLQGTIAAENKPECTHTEEVSDAIKFVDDITLNPDDSDKDIPEKTESGKAEENVAKVSPNQEKEMPVEADEENECNNQQQDQKKIKEGKPKDKANLNEKKTSKRHVNKKSNIQKIPTNGKVNIKSLVEEDSNDDLLNFNGIKVQELRMSVKRDGNEDDIESPKEKKVNTKSTDLENCTLSPPLNQTEENCTSVATNTTNVALEEALIPVGCLSCDKKVVKNVVSYPIFNKKPGDDEKIHINIDNCGCLNTLDEETNSTNKHKPFTFDLDDLTLIHGQPVTQASLVRDMAPKFLKNIVAAKTLSHYLPVVRSEPKVNMVPHHEGLGNVGLISHMCPGCMCKHCICNVQRPTVYEEQPRLVLVEQPYEEEVVRVVPSIVHRPTLSHLPSYMSRQMSRPLATYGSGIVDNSQDILVPVDVIPSEGIVTGRCGSCAPYVGELNES